MPPKRKALAEISTNILTRKRLRSIGQTPSSAEHQRAEHQRAEHQHAELQHAENESAENQSAENQSTENKSTESSGNTGIKIEFKLKQKIKTHVEASNLPPIPIFEPYKSRFPPHEAQVSDIKR